VPAGWLAGWLGAVRVVVILERVTRSTLQGYVAMQRFARNVRRLVADDNGGEVLEYALIAGLIVIAAIAVIGSVGTKVLARWTSLNDGM
jgi:Flp pilus assembly pilin Flp